MSHPDLISQLLRHPLPSELGESGASDVAGVPAAVQAGEREQAAQACRRGVHKRGALEAVAARMFGEGKR